jgi:hypothetical protein
VDEGDRGQASAPRGVQESKRQPAHRPPAHHLRTKLVQVPRKHPVVVARKAEALTQAQRLDASVAERPAHLAVNILFVHGVGCSGSRVGGEHADGMTAPAQVLDR